VSVLNPLLLPCWQCKQNTLCVIHHRITMIYRGVAIFRNGMNSTTVDVCSTTGHRPFSPAERIPGAHFLGRWM